MAADFLHASLGEEEKVFVDIPWGLETKGKNGRIKVLKLKKTIYVLRQSPRAIWKYMASKMEICGIVQSKLDPCLFIGNKVMAIIYVDEIIF